MMDRRAMSLNATAALGIPPGASEFVLRVVHRKGTQDLHMFLNEPQAEFFYGLCHASQTIHRHPDEPYLVLVPGPEFEFDQKEEKD